MASFPQSPIPTSVESKMKPALALELAAQLRPAVEVLKQFGITADEWEIIKKHPHFQRAFSEAKEFWESDKNAAERVKCVSTMMVEESLVTLFEMTHDVELHPSSRLDAFKTIAKIAGVDNSGSKAVGPGGGPTQERFQININLTPVDGNPVNQVVIDAEPLSPLTSDEEIKPVDET